jgi:flagellar protein FlgJ
VINSSSLQSQSIAESYTDLSSLNAITGMAAGNKNQALDEISKQFESMMVRMMMKSMRSANEVFAEGNMLSSHAGDMYQEMYDDQLALSLSKDGGMGIADVMVRQLRDRFGEAESLPAAESNDDDLSSYQDHKINALAVSPVESETSLIKHTNNDEINAAQTKTASINENAVTFTGATDDFITQMYPLAKQAADKLGIDAEVLIAQSALETGWGRKINQHSDGQSSFNLFNIKANADWDGNKVVVPTIEYKNDVPVREFANFRSYSSPQKSFDDYVEFVGQSPRYSDAINAENSEVYVKELSNAGYATDPDYANKILRIMNSETMQKTVAQLNLDIPQG